MGTGLRVIFMGTPDFAVPALDRIIRAGHDVVAVYSQPPRPKGRGQQTQKSPVHLRADADAIPVFTPRSLKKDAEARAVFAAHKADVAVVAAYGLILPKDVLDAPRHGCLNIHASLLPRWRGASPIQHAVLSGDEMSGVTIMQMEEGLDTGPMILKRTVALTPATTAQGLHDELSALGGLMILDALDSLAAGQALQGEAQNDALSTYAPMLSKDSGRVDWTRPAVEIDRMRRAFTPWPGLWTMAGEKRVKIMEAEIADEAFSAPPGTLIDRSGHIACGGDTALRLTRIQPENSRPMDVASAVNGGHLNLDIPLG